MLFVQNIGKPTLACAARKCDQERVARADLVVQIVRIFSKKVGDKDVRRPEVSLKDDIRERSVGRRASGGRIPEIASRSYAYPQATDGRR